MFESVGKNLDEKQQLRQLVAAFLTFAILSTTICSITVYQSVMAIMNAVAPEPLEAIPEEMVAVDMEEEIEEEEPPPPPPPPPQGAVEEEEEDEDVEDEVIPQEEMEEDVQKLEDVKDISSTKVKQYAEGDPLGEVGGQPDGKHKKFNTGPKTFHHSELKIKRQVTPKYPKAAEDLNLGAVRCRVRIFIDTDGIPYEYGFEACPTVFQGSAKEAISKWRWYPAKDPTTREKIKAQFLLSITYKP